MKKFTVITKDGSKWLRQPGARKSDAIYLGIHPEGTLLDESEVRITTQTTSEPRDEENYFTRDVYVDAESHDRHIIADYPGVDYQPLFNHMSKVHGLTLTTGEMDEIIGLSTYILSKK